MTNFSIYLDL